MADKTDDGPGRDRTAAELIEERLDAIEKKLGLGEHKSKATTDKSGGKSAEKKKEGK